MVEEGSGGEAVAESMCALSKVWPQHATIDRRLVFSPVGRGQNIIDSASRHACHGIMKL